MLIRFPARRPYAGAVHRVLITSANQPRRGAAVVEFAVCLPLIVMLLLGLWEVGRITEVQQVICNSGREAARDASLGRNNLLTVTANLTTYLQSAEPTAFGKNHATSIRPPVISLPANTTGYTVWDDTANRELFTITFKNLTDTSVTDPTGMKQLDRYVLGVQVPYSSIGWIPVAQITGKDRLYATVTWVSMIDSPFQLPSTLPPQ